MSSIARAKQRILMRSNSIVSGSQYEKEVQQQQLLNIPTKRPFKVQSVANYKSSKNKIQIYEPQQRDFSPQFAKTQRIQLIQTFWNPNQDEELLSERNSPNEKPKQKQRRITSYANKFVEASPVPQKIDKAKQFKQLNSSTKQYVHQSHSLSKIPKVHGDQAPLIIATLAIRRAYSPVKPKECSKQYTDKVIEQQTHKVEGFRDDLFPPRQSIIFTKRLLYQQEGLAFQRVTRIYENNNIQILQFSEASYLIEGKYTSGAVYSAFIILAEDPTRLANIFYNQSPNEQGIYYLHLCKDGVWRYIIIDDYLPIKMGVKASLMCLHSLGVKNSYQIWGSLLEKGLAKIYGTYEDLNMTKYEGVKHIFRILTGLPVSQYQINKDFRSYLFLIDTALKKKQIVVLEAIHQDLTSLAAQYKIYPYKSYQILDAKKNYITIRNLQSTSLTTKINIQEAILFSKLLIFRNQKNYVHISQKLRHKKYYYCVINLTISSNQTRCYFDVWENNSASYKKHLNSKLDCQIRNYTISIKGIEGEEGEEDYLLNESGKEIVLKKGKYQINVHVCQIKQQDFTLSYYGEHQIILEKLKNNKKWQHGEQTNCQCSDHLRKSPL